MRYFELKYALYLNNAKGHYKCVLKKIEMSERMKEQVGTWKYDYINQIVEDLNSRYMRNGWPYEIATPSNKIKGTEKENGEFGLKFAKKRLFMRVFSEILDMMDVDYDRMISDVNKFKDLHNDIFSLKTRIWASITVMYTKAAMAEGDTEEKDFETALYEQQIESLTRKGMFIQPGVITEETDVTPYQTDEEFAKDRGEHLCISENGIIIAAEKLGIDSDRAKELIQLAVDNTKYKLMLPKIEMSGDDEDWGEDDE